MKPFAACLLLFSTLSLAAQDQPKNLKVLKDLPQDQLVPVMVFMSNSLGVSCMHCHTNKWESDEKEAKGVARTMITMVRDVNDRHFGGEQAITCNSCHRGQIRPITTPRIAAAYYNAPPAPPKSTTPVPPVAQIADKYSKVAHPVTEGHGTMTRVDGASAPFTVHEGVVKTTLGYPPEANDALKLPTLNRERLAAIGVETVRGHETYILEQRRDRLYIDTQSGALVRWHHEISTDLGNLPDETDYDGNTITWSRGDVKVTFKLE
jgi:hypothetical protein